VGNESDPNVLNNVSISSTIVTLPSVNLVLGLVGTPNPLFIANGNNLTYTLTVTNFGPATATGVSITNTLPPGVVFLSATPAGSYTLSSSVVTFTNLGNLTFGGTPATATITVRAVTPGILTNRAECASLVIESHKPSNIAEVKTVVDYPSVNYSIAGNNLILTWPAASGYTLQSATNLAVPVWTVVTNPPPVNVGGTYYFTNNIETGTRFFRLQAVGP
jgi:uncharacterized repeat protein (TIGR01451 family)